MSGVRGCGPRGREWPRSVGGAPGASSPEGRRNWADSGRTGSGRPASRRPRPGDGEIPPRGRSGCRGRVVDGGGSGALGRWCRPLVWAGGGDTGGMAGTDGAECAEGPDGVAGGIEGTDGGEDGEDGIACPAVGGSGLSSSATTSSLLCRERRGGVGSSSCAARRCGRDERRPLDSAPRSAACRASISATLMPPWVSSARRRFLSASSRLRCARARHSSA